jgi:hypothetical protein
VSQHEFVNLCCQLEGSTLVQRRKDQYTSRINVGGAACQVSSDSLGFSHHRPGTVSDRSGRVLDVEVSKCDTLCSHYM